MDKREARREFKLRKTPKGVFAVRCTATGEVWVGGSTHLDSAKNGLWYQLRNGLHRNQRLQAAWNARGEAAFAFEIVEELDPELAPLLVGDTLGERSQHWLKAMGAAAV